MFGRRPVKGLPAQLAGPTALVQWQRSPQHRLLSDGGTSPRGLHKGTEKPDLGLRMPVLPRLL